MSENSTKFVKIQYCKQKLSQLIESFFSQDLGKEIKNNIEYRPFALEKIQNYNPIYRLFFEMNQQNYNSFTLNQKYRCAGVDLICEQSSDINNTINKPIFIKYAPLLDPLRYLVGNYTETAEQLQCLPSFSDNTDINSNSNICSKLLETNNASYIDNFFCYLSSQLLNHHNFLNGIDYYGSVLAIQSKYKFNVVDDIEYLMQSSYFRNQQGILYEIESIVEDPFTNFGSRRNKNKLVFDSNDTDVIIEIEDLNIIDDDCVYDCVSGQEDIVEMLEENNIEVPIHNSDTVLKDSSSETDSEIDKSDDCQDSNNEKDEECDNEHNTEDSNDSEDSEDSEDTDKDSKDSEDSEDSEDTDTDTDTDSKDSEDTDEEDEEDKFAYIYNFPVQMIMLEKCEGTLDELFLKGNIQDEHVANAILMQIIMTLLVYQQACHFTHNDLHTNNIMWNTTELDFLYYKFQGKIYRVPTYGRIFKIIDFGRSIYKFQGKIFCSDSFAPEGDASSQYNCEPYFNEKKARLEPNYSFDLCRLGTSLYDFLFDEGIEPDTKKMDSFQRVVYEWCKDDEGRNVLYKKNGDERYPGFKLYKMIARLVHKHTPAAQLERKQFSKYIYNMKDGDNIDTIMDIDALPNYTTI